MEILDRAVLALMMEEIAIMRRLIKVKQQLMVLRRNDARRTARRPRQQAHVAQPKPDEQVP